MPILVGGLSYRGASLDLLERVSFTGDVLDKGLHELQALEHVGEAVILSTCNRVEVYVVVPGFHTGVATVRQFLSGVHHVDAAEFSPALYTLYEDAAVRHLFGVAGGIDSMVLGEPQILAQVREAFRVATHRGTVGPILSALFRHAIRAGRRARAETHIARSGVTFAVAGARLARDELHGLAGKTVLVIGAGKMSDLAAREIARMKAEVLVANRTPAHADALAHTIGGTAVPMSALDASMERADLIISSTGAAAPIVTRDVLDGVMARRRDRPLMILDLAVPRDVDPACADIPGVSVRDLDALREALAPTAEQLLEVGRVAAIVDAETPRFVAWQRAHRLAPLMETLQKRAESVRAREIQRAASKLAALDPSEREAVEALTRAIVAKLLHEPVTALKERAGSPEGDALARALEELFDLDS
jgi:glutamyl-tRNA reductase